MTQERRLRILGLVVLVVFGLAFVRATQLTTVSAKGLQGKLAEGRQPQTIAAPRGSVTDSKGRVLAISEGASDISATPFLIKDPSRVAEQLSPLVGLTVTQLLPKLSGTGGFAWIARLVPEARAKKVAALGIEGITLTPRTRRQYPQDTVASQLLGMSGVDGQGLSGLELSLDDTLRGRDGKRLLVYGRGGREAKAVYIKDEQPTLPGKSVKLTIDSTIQSHAEDLLAQAGTDFAPKVATAIVMQPSTGDVLALASWPKVDANQAGEAPTGARDVMATAFPYEPGSTFKPFTVAGAIEDGKVTPDTTFVVPPVLQVADRKLHDAEEHGTEIMSVSDILAKSSNIGTVKIAQTLGTTKDGVNRSFDKWIRRFGFGKTTGVQVPGEQRGKIINVDDYSGSSIANLPIGQGELVTPMQLAAGYSTIANDGVREEPTVVDEVNGKAESRPEGKRVISTSTAKKMRRMLERVTEAGGTAASSQIAGYDVAAKTGTAQKVVPGKAEYSKTLYTSSLIGMAPADRPKIVVAVIIDQPTRNGYYGAVVAGPTFQKLTSWTLNYLGVAPN